MWPSRRSGERRPGAYGFWDDFQDAIEEARHSLASGGGSIYQAFSSSSGWSAFNHRSYSQGPGPIGISRGTHWDGFGIPRHELESALRAFGHSSVTFHAGRFLADIISKIKNAADWQTLNRIAAPLLGQQSLAAGLLYGIGESLVGDVVALLGLAKLVVLAGLYERIKRPALLNFADPMTLTLILAVREMPWLNREAKKADEQLWNTLKELKEIASHPIKFVEIVGQNSWKGVAKDWNDLKSYGSNPTVTGDFQAGRIMGHALYQIIMMILLAMSVAGVAVKLAARFPWLMRLARIISRGGKLEELEGLGEGIKAGEGTEDAANARKGAQKKPAEPPEEKKPKVNKTAVESWRDSLKTRQPAGQNMPDARNYQIRNCGDKEYLVKGGGKQIWADGINTDDGLLQDAKFVRDPAKSPFVPDSNIPDELRTVINEDVDEEFKRYAAVIKDADTPVSGLQVITNEPQAVPFFQGLMQKYGVPGNIVVKP